MNIIGSSSFGIQNAVYLNSQKNNSLGFGVIIPGHTEISSVENDYFQEDEKVNRWGQRDGVLFVAKPSFDNGQPRQDNYEEIRSSRDWDSSGRV